MAPSKMMSRVAAAVVVAAAMAVVGVSGTTYGSQTFYGDSSCTGRIYYQNVFPNAACVPDSTCTYAGTNSYYTVSCPTTYLLSPPYGTYSVGYIFSSATECSADDFLVGSYTYYSIANTCSALGTGYVKSTCGAASTPLTYWCSDPSCTSCATFSSNSTCQPIPGSTDGFTSYCTSGAATSRPATIMVAVLLVVATAVASVFAF